MGEIASREERVDKCPVLKDGVRMKGDGVVAPSSNVISLNCWDIFFTDSLEVGGSSNELPGAVVRVGYLSSA